MCFLQRKEFNVKTIHTKLAKPSHNVNAYGAASTDNLPETPHKLKAIELLGTLKSKEASNNFRRLNVDIFIEEVAINLYDEDIEKTNRKREIASLYLDDIFVSFTDEKRQLEIGLSSLQIDNQLFSSGKFDFPVILCGQNVNEIPKETLNMVHTSAEKIHFCGDLLPTPFSLHFTKPFLLANQLIQINVIFDENKLSLREIHCQIEPLRVYIEDKFISLLLDFAIENLPANIIYSSPKATKRLTCDAGEVLMPPFVTEQILSFYADPLRIERICIKPLNVLLSVHTCMR